MKQYIKNIMILILALSWGLLLTNCSDSESDYSDDNAYPPPTDRETSSSGTKTEKSDGSVNIWDGSLVIFLIGITFCAVFVKTSVDVTSIPAASRVLTLTFKSNSSVISVCRVSIFKR